MLVEASLGFVNRLLADQGWPLSKLGKFAGQAILIELGEQHFLLQITREGFLKSARPQLAPVVTITLPSDALFRVPVERSALLSTARISGPAEFAECLNQIFRNLEWDIAGSLSPLCGDILANRIVRFGRGLSSRQPGFLTRLSQNFAEFLVVEKPLLIGRDSLSVFCRDLDHLLTDFASLERRIELLEGIADV